VFGIVVYSSLLFTAIFLRHFLTDHALAVFVGHLHIA